MDLRRLYHEIMEILLEKSALHALGGVRIIDSIAYFDHIVVALGLVEYPILDDNPHAATYLEESITVDMIIQEMKEFLDCGFIGNHRLMVKLLPFSNAKDAFWIYERHSTL